MDTKTLVARLLIDGCVRVPGVLSGRELEEMRAAFERVATRLGKRWFNWEEVCLEPEFVRYIAHPNLMAVVDGFVNHLGHEAVFANSAGARDAFDPKKPDKFDPPNLRRGPIGWHDDVQGMTKPNPDMLQATLTSLLYLDETFADNGAYCSAVGSHHLAGISTDHKPIVANSDLVLDQCELRPIPVKPGDVIVHRGHHWHGVVPPSVMRRLVLQTFSTRKQYDLQLGHTQLSEATVAMIAPERKKYLQWYAKK
jgi:hypothetical protein